MRKKGIRGLTKQLTALMLTAAMVLGPVGGGIQSTAASQDSAAVTAVEKTEKSAVDTADEAKAEAADKQEAKAESKTEQKTEQAAAVQSAAQKADTKQDTKDSQQAAETNTKTDASKDNDDKESAAKDTANIDASGKADSKSDAADANSKSDDKQTVSDKADNADAKQGSVDTGDSKQSSDNASSKDNTAKESDAKNSADQTVVSPAKDGKTETVDSDKKSEQSDADEKNAEKKTSEEKTVVEKAADVEKDAELSEAFSAFKSVDGVIITVTAPEGVVPTGTKLHAKKVSKQATLDKVNEAIGEASEAEETAEPDYVFDIKLVYNGEEIEPDTSYGDVNVTFTLDKEDVKDSDKISVYHIKEQDETLTANAIADLKVSQDTLPDAASKTQLAKKEITSISFDTESFSYYAVMLSSLDESETYTVTFDYGEKQYYEDSNIDCWWYLASNGGTYYAATEETAKSYAVSKLSVNVPVGQALGQSIYIPTDKYDEGKATALFNGWQDKAGNIIIDKSNSVYNIASYVPTSDIELSIAWATDIYTVTFDYEKDVYYQVSDTEWRYLTNGGYTVYASTEEEAKSNAVSKVNISVLSGQSLNESVYTPADKYENDKLKALFNGWQDKDGNIIIDEDNNTYSYIPTSDITLTPVWISDVCMVTFDYEEPQYYQDSYGDWYYLASDGTTRIAGTETEAKSEAVSIVKIGAINGHKIKRYLYEPSYEYDAEGNITELFGGWVSESDDSKQTIAKGKISSYTATGDITFKPNWLKDIYTVTFDYGQKQYGQTASGLWWFLSKEGYKQNISNEEQAKSRAESKVCVAVSKGQSIGQNIYVPNDIYDENGALKAIFKYWKNNDSSIVVEADKIYSYIPSENVSFDIEWEYDVCTVTFDYTEPIYYESGNGWSYLTNDGEFYWAETEEEAKSKAASKVCVNSEKGKALNKYIYTPSNKYKDDKLVSIFKGWKTEDGDEIDKNGAWSYEPTSDTIFKAEWTDDVCTVTFDYGTPQYYKGANGSWYYLNESGYSSSASSEEEAEKYAVSKVKIEIVNGQKLDRYLYEPSYKYAEDGSISAVFDGWVSESDDSKQTIAKGEVSSYTANGDVTFKPDWINDVYTVIFDYGEKIYHKISDNSWNYLNENGDLYWTETEEEAEAKAVSKVSIGVIKGQALSKSVYTPSDKYDNGKLTAVFKGWQDEGGNIIIDKYNSYSYVPTSDITLTAAWATDIHTVTFDYGEKVYYKNSYNDQWSYLSEDGYIQTAENEEIAESKAVSTVNIYAINGQSLNKWVHAPEDRYDDNGALIAVFEGWKNEERGITLGKHSVVDYIPTEDITFKAIWNTTIYKVTLDLTDKVILVDGGDYYYINEDGRLMPADSQEEALAQANRYITTYVVGNQGYSDPFNWYEEGSELNGYTVLIGDNKARFAGWKAEDGTVKETININSVSSDKTFTASWDTDLVKVEYNLGDKIVWEYDNGYDDIEYYCINAEGSVVRFTTKEEAEANACDSLTTYVRKNTELGDDISGWGFAKTAVSVDGELVMFDGWRSDNGQIVGSYNLSDYIPTADTVFNATWTNKLYKVELDFTDKVVTGGAGYYRYIMKNGSLRSFYSDNDDIEEALEKSQQIASWYIKKGQSAGKNPIKTGTIVVTKDGEVILNGWKDAAGNAVEFNRNYVPTSDVKLKAVLKDQDFFDVTIDTGIEGEEPYTFECLEGTNLGNEENYGYQGDEDATLDDVYDKLETGIAGKVFKHWVDSDGKTYARNKIKSLVIDKDIQLKAVWDTAVEYTLTIHPNNGDEAYKEEVSKGDAYAPDIDETEYPDNAVSYELYTDAAFTKPLAAYLKDNNGYAGDIDIYVKWIYEGKWVEADGKYKYQYTTGEYAKNQLIVTEGEYDTERYYADKDGYRVTNTWVRIAADAEAYDSYGICNWWYYFGEDGIAYTKNFAQTINGKQYGFDAEGHQLFGFVEQSSYDLQYADEVNGFIYGDYFYGQASDYDNKDPEANARRTGWVAYTLEEDYEDYKAGDKVYLYFNTQNGKKYADITSVIGGVSYTFDECGVSDKQGEAKLKITFDKAGGDNGTSEVYTSYGDKLYKIAIPVKAGNVFAGYYSEKNGAGKQYYKGDGTSAVEAMDSKADITLYAKWISVNIKDTIVDTSAIETSTETEKKAVEAIKSNKEAAKAAEDLASAIDGEKLEAAVSEQLTADGIDPDKVSELSLALKVELKNIASKSDKVTGISFEAKPYVLISVKGSAEVITKPVDNDLLIGNEQIKIKLPIPDNTNGDYVKVVHKFSDGSGFETFTSKILGTSPSRYIEFSVSSFSEFELTFTDVYYTLDDIASVTYTGNAQKPHVTVKQGDAVVDASQYKVSYAKNVDAGTATVTVEFINTGDKLSKNFVITKAKPSIEASDITITYDGTSHAASGKASIPNGINLADDKVKVKYYTDANCTKGETEVAPKRVGTYYAKLYVDAASNYEYAEKIVKITIKAKNSSGGSSSGGSSSGGSGGGGGAYSSGVAALKFGAGSTAALVPDKGVAGTWKKNELGKWTFTSNDKHEYSYEWAYIANPNADTAKGQEAASWFRFGTDGTMLTGWYKNVYGDWYYLNPISDNTMGAMLKGWQYINGYWYYLEEKEAASLGRLYVSKQTPDGKTVDAEGRWVKNGAAVTDANTKPTA